MFSGFLLFLVLRIVLSSVLYTVFMVDEELVRQAEQFIDEGYRISEVRRALAEDGYSEETIRRVLERVEADLEQSSGNQDTPDKSPAEDSENPDVQQKPREEDDLKETGETSGESGSDTTGISLKSGALAGLKAGVVTGLSISLVSGLIVIGLGSAVGGLLGAFAAFSGILIVVASLTSGLISFSIGGVVFGTLFAALEGYIPGDALKPKGIIYGTSLGALNSVTLLSSGLNLGNAIVAALTIASLVLWGYLTARFLQP